VDLRSVARQTVDRVRSPGHGTSADRQTLEAELARARRQLRRAQRQLRAARAQISEAHHALPADVERVIGQVVEERLTFLGAPHLRNLATCVVDIEAAGVPGIVIEAGTALGGSAITIAAAKDPGRPMRVYDVFDMIPAPSERDGPDVHRRYDEIAGGTARGRAGDVYYGYHENLLDEVRASFTRLGVPLDENRVELLPGLFQDTLELDGPVAFAHLDGDWYDSTMTCLERIAPRLSTGGRIVVDDYYAWSGCRRAVDDYFADVDGFRLLRRAKLHVVKV
jgi:asparagine synthase (glutamine-hydrolysing)